MKRAFLIFVLCIFSIPSFANAQDQKKEGLFIGIGLGAGSLGGGDSEERDSGGSAFFRIGGLAHANLLLGAEAEFWSKKFEGGSLTVGGINLMAYFYPKPSMGLYFKGGLGSARADFGGEAGFLSGVSIGGFSSSLGLGYDFHRGSNFALTPNASVQFYKFDALGNVNVLAFGLGVNWY